VKNPRAGINGDIQRSGEWLRKIVFGESAGYDAPMSHIVRECDTGRGVFATAAIAAGSLIMEYTGPLLCYAQTTPQTLALQIGPDLYLGGSGQADDFVNHCCEPNAGIRIRGAAVELIALRAIKIGEQITFDYSTTMDEDDFEFTCRCGSRQCRGRIRDFKHLPAELRRHYADRGIVPEYNLRYLSPQSLS
jgi:hypothetical protein